MNIFHTYSVSGCSVEIVQRFAQKIRRRLSKLSFSVSGVSQSSRKPSRGFLQHFLSALDCDYNSRNLCGFHQRFICITAISDMAVIMSVISHFWEYRQKPVVFSRQDWAMQNRKRQRFNYDENTKIFEKIRSRHFLCKIIISFEDKYIAQSVLKGNMKTFYC